ncbi:flagellin [Mesorhizobium sp. KR1-2]|uniref:flagellin N-terminal helical domain-containing protein n=1 Tax=Mesorhizobium sp. KR1-2 TaxID=3156609 RepID=UPI0032B3C086
MSSILTNASAMTALQTLSQTNKNLSTTQGRIATGLRVAQASDNAAYWSIATTMRSDNKSMSTVKDALGLGAAQVDVAYTAMDSVKNTLDTMKAKLVAASQPNVDKNKIQEDLKQLQNDLQTFAKSATFSGGNWLSVDKASEQKIVASFIRAADGSISLGTIDVDTAKSALFNAATDEYGLLQQGGVVKNTDDLDAGTDFDGSALNDGDAIELDDVFGGHDFTDAATGTITLKDNAAIKFDVTINKETVRVTIDRAVLDAAGLEDGKITDEADLVEAVNQAFKNAGIDGKLQAETGTTGIKLALIDKKGDAVTFDEATDDENTYNLAVSNIRTSSNGNFFEATGFDITKAESLDMKEFLQGVDKMLSAVTTAASDLGALKSRIDTQQTFVKDLMNAVDRGIGVLVDADMNEESTRLQALQVQQQLGIQALSIANQSPQSILSLFR